jgi:hypothetical protein
MGGRLALWEVLEASLRVDLRGHTLRTVDGGFGADRLGLGALVMGIGIGTGNRRAAAGLRIEASAGASALELEAYAAGAAKHSLLLRPAATLWLGLFRVGLGLYGGLLFDEGNDASVGTFGAGGALAATLGDVSASAFPLLGVEVDWTEEVRPAVRLRVGASIESADLRLQGCIVIALPNDPTGQVAGLELVLLRSEN